MPDPTWSLDRRKHRWYPGETISVAIGQGPLLVTPLQMAAMMAAVANGGRMVVPHLRAGETQPAGRLKIPDGALDQVRHGLWAVVNAPHGTGRASQVPGLAVAGKTGTAQVVAQAPGPRTRTCRTRSAITPGSPPSPRSTTRSS